MEKRISFNVSDETYDRLKKVSRSNIKNYRHGMLTKIIESGLNLISDGINGLDLNEQFSRYKLEVERYRRKSRGRKKRYNYSKILRMKALGYYSKGTFRCACCNESTLQFLTIDHVNGGGCKHRKEIGSGIYYWLKRNKYPDGFQVLCMNCNWGKARNKDTCPHKEKALISSYKDVKNNIET